MPILSAALAAFNEMFSPPFRTVLWKSLGLTLVLLALAWTGLDKAILHFAADPSFVHWPWLATTVTILTGIGLVVGLAFLLAPVSALVAGFFLDDLAEVVEREIYPPGETGRALTMGEAMAVSLRFAILSALVNLLALAVFLIPGVNALAFFVANAFLFGREYFALAAMRYRPREEVHELVRENGVVLFVAGLVIAGFLAVPILNLLTPLFATAFMVRLHKALAPISIGAGSLQARR